MGRDSVYIQELEEARGHLPRYLGIKSTDEISVVYRKVLDRFAATVHKYSGYSVNTTEKTVELLSVNAEGQDEIYGVPYTAFTSGDLSNLSGYLVVEQKAIKKKIEKKEVSLPNWTKEYAARVLAEVNELKTKMMNTEELKARLDADLKVAMKAKDTMMLGTVRMLKAAITNAEKVDPAAPVDWMKVFQTEAKKRAQAAEEFTKGGALDKAAQEVYEKVYIESLLPTKMSEEQTSVALVSIKDELGFASQKDMGKLIKEFQARYPGLQDGAVVSRLAKALLV